MGGPPRSEEGTFIVDGIVPTPSALLAAAKPILESYHDTYDDLLPVDSTTRVLDVGCGLGHFLLYVQARGAKRVLGVDVGSRQVELCRAIGFEAETIESIPSALKAHNATFDLIHFSHVIEHIHPSDLPDVLSAIRTALAPGGRFVIRTPNMSHWLAAHMRYLDLTHVTGFTAWSLRQALWSSGFRSVEILPGKPRLHWRPKRLAWLIAQKALHSILRFGTYIELGTDRPTILTAELIAIARSE